MSYNISPSLIMPRILTERGKPGQRHTRRENAKRLIIGSEVRAMHWQTKDTKGCQQLPEVRKARKDPPPEPSEGERLCLDFRLLTPEL